MSAHTDFLARLDSIIESNLDDEQFGVGSLADMMAMSRSSLHRRLHKIAGVSISKYIRNYRLKKAMDLLTQTDMNACEVAHTVGFSSASYFSRCFSEFYGHPPSKVNEHLNNDRPSTSRSVTRPEWIIVPTVTVLLIFVAWWVEGSNKMRVDPGMIDEAKKVYVMPFENLDDNPKNEYLVKGMNEAITRRLSQLSNLEILSPMAFDPKLKGFQLISRISETSGNPIILCGSLRQMDTLFLLELKLLDSKTRKVLFAEGFNKESGNFIQMENEASTWAIKKLNSKWDAENRTLIDTEPAKNPRAYEFYLQGCYYTWDFKPERLKKAKYYFEQAIREDSTMALSYMGLTTLYNADAALGIFGNSPKGAFKQSKFYLNKAISLNPNVPYLHTANGFIANYADWDFKKTDEQYKLAIKDNEPLAFYLYRNFLLQQGRFDEALEKAQYLNHNFPFFIGAPLLLPYYYTGQIEKGKAYLEKKMAADTKDLFSMDNAAFFYLNIGEYEKALEICKKIVNASGKYAPKTLALMGAAFAHMGQKEEAQKIIQELQVRKDTTDVGAPALYLGVINTAMGNHSKALEWLEIAVDDREMEIPWLAKEPQLYPLHGHPRFDALLQKVGFPTYVHTINK